MEHKTFFEIQKTYLNTEMKQTNRCEQEGIYAKRGHQQPESSHLHISGNGCCDSSGLSIINQNVADYKFVQFGLET